MAYQEHRSKHFKSAKAGFSRKDINASLTNAPRELFLNAPSSGRPHTYQDGTIPTVLTNENITKHCHSSECLWSCPTSSSQKRKKQSEHISADIQLLAGDLPHELINKMIQNFDGMKPMERFLVEPGGYTRKVEDIERIDQSPKNEPSDARTHADAPLVGVVDSYDREGSPNPQMSEDRWNLGLHGPQ